MSVALVGAGPGDPELITRRGLRLIQQCQVLIYDRLVGPELVAEAPAGALLIDRDGSEQEEVNDLLVEYGLLGLRVVRLKGGDPFVFGRGGEEAQALERAGISYDVVPGVSSAIAAPASAGIPLTHRDHASGFFVVSGHDTTVFTSAIGALRPSGVTVVVLMGYGRRAELTTLLVDAGWDRSTPAAIVAEGTLPTEQVWRGTLGELASGQAALETDGPAILVIGAVAALNLNGRALASVAALDETTEPQRWNARQQRT